MPSVLQVISAAKKLKNISILLLEFIFLIKKYKTRTVINSD